MHEMSIAESLLALAEEEAAAKGCDKLLALRVEYGVLAGLMPEALAFCVEALVKGTRHEGLALEIVKLPLILRCPFCQTAFEGESPESVWQPCPKCGELFGFTVEGGRELVLARLEAIQSNSVAILPK